MSIYGYDENFAKKEVIKSNIGFTILGTEVAMKMFKNTISIDNINTASTVKMTAYTGRLHNVVDLDKTIVLFTAENNNLEKPYGLAFSYRIIHNESSDVTQIVVWAHNPTSISLSNVSVSMLIIGQAL